MSRTRLSGYSNVNDRFRTLRTERVTNQDVERFKSGRHHTKAAEEMVAEVEEATKDRNARQAVLDLKEMKRLMDARTDRRTRPPGVSKAAFKLYRALGLKPIPAKK